MAVDVSKKASKPTWRDSLAAAVAVCALLAFLALVLLMFLQRGSSETTWSRLVYLLTGLEAVAFAGAGWIFGKEVHKAEVSAPSRKSRPNGSGPANLRTKRGRRARWPTPNKYVVPGWSRLSKPRMPSGQRCTAKRGRSPLEADRTMRWHQ